MKKLYIVSAVSLFFACQFTIAKAEGLALTEWSSRGLSLAGGMLGRADDPSAIAYNAAGITQLPGTHFMGGFASFDPTSTIDLNLKDDGGIRHTSITSQPHVWSAPYAYITQQLNERFWLGLGLFSRFGIESNFTDDWAGRYNVTNFKFKTLTLMPTVAMKVNNALSLSVGVEIMRASLTIGQQIPSLQFVEGSPYPKKGEDSKMTINGTDWSVGAHLGVLLHMTDKLSLGFSYKSPVTLHIDGSADFSRHQSNMLADQAEVPHTVDTNVHSTIHLPDSFALGLTYRPQENLSFEVGTVFTRWSAYDSLDISFETDFTSHNHNKWRNGWNFNASMEYEPTNWLALRAGVWYETAVTNEAHANFMVPGHGRTGASVGTGIRWGSWRFDMAYAHLWMRGLDYSETDATGINSSVGNIYGGSSRDMSTHIYSAALSYTF